MVSSVKQGSWQDLTVWRWWVNIGETIQVLTSLRLTWIFILHPTASLHCVAGLCFLLSRYVTLNQGRGSQTIPTDSARRAWVWVWRT